MEEAKEKEPYEDEEVGEITFKIILPPYLAMNWLELALLIISRSKEMSKTKN